MTAFTPGMRVVVADGDWPFERIAGTYGKVTEVSTMNGQDYIGFIPTGHIDGGDPPDLTRLDVFPFYPEELAVID